MSQTDKYLLVKGTSGIGNRIFALATAILYSQITKRQLVVDWTDTSYGGSDNFNSFSYFFDCSVNQDLSVLPQTDDIFPEVWIGNLDMTFGGMQQKLKQEGLNKNLISCQVTQIDYPQQILVFGSYSSKIHLMKKQNYLTGKFAEYAQLDVKAILTKIIKENINISEHLTAKFNQFIKDKFCDYTIGVHIRYSDMKVPVEEIYKLVEKQLKKKPTATIFLATDSQMIMEEFKQKFNNVIVAEKWFSPNGERLHQNWDECQDRLTNGIEALQDIYLLSRCQSLIFSSQSSFGYLASILKDDPEEVYDIKIPPVKQKLIKKTKQYLKINNLWLPLLLFFTALSLAYYFLKLAYLVM